MNLQRSDIKEKFYSRIKSENMKLVDIIYCGLNSNSGSSYYSTPNALFGAMAAGKPINTTNTCEIFQFIQDQQCGIIIDLPEPGDFAQAI